jgi:hypothetical protein
MSVSDERTIGQHGARLDALERDIEEIKADVKQVLQQMAEAKGGWRLLMLVGGMSATVGGFIAKYLPLK